MLISIVSHCLNLLVLDIIFSSVKHVQYIVEFYWFYFDINSNCILKLKESIYFVCNSIVYLFVHLTQIVNKFRIISKQFYEVTYKKI